MKGTAIRLIVNAITTTVLSYLTMLALMRVLPLRQLLGFASESMTWGPPQSFPFAFADLIYSQAAITSSIILGLCAGLMVTFLDINGKKWWIIFGSLFFVFVVGTLVILHLASAGWDRHYGRYFLDVLLCPLLLLIEVEILVYLKSNRG